MGTILTLIIGGIIGWLAGLIMGRDLPGGIIGNIIAGLIGSFIGGKLFGDFGPVIGAASDPIAIIPALLGAIILIAVVSFVLRQMN